jgi:hypothetical protein
MKKNKAQTARTGHNKGIKKLATWSLPGAKFAISARERAKTRAEKKDAA